MGTQLLAITDRQSRKCNQKALLGAVIPFENPISFLESKKEAKFFLKRVLTKLYKLYIIDIYS